MKLPFRSARCDLCERKRDNVLRLKGEELTWLVCGECADGMHKLFHPAAEAEPEHRGAWESATWDDDGES